MREDLNVMYKMKHSLLLFLPIFLLSNAIGEEKQTFFADQKSEYVDLTKLREPRQRIGPLMLEKVENNLIFSKWSDKVVPHGRRIGGHEPAPDDRTPSQVTFSLSHITPFWSKDPKQNSEYISLFTKGLRELLANREFYAESVHANYGRPGTFIVMAIISHDSYSRGEIQKEMVKNGYAKVNHRHSTYMIERFGDDYRDELLRLEGEARSKKLGGWEN